MATAAKSVDIHAPRKMGEVVAAYNGGARIVACKGGTRSGKTWSVLMLLLHVAVAGRVLVSVVSESVPHLKRGALRDFQRILDACGWVEGEDYRHNATDNIFDFGTGRIEFFSADNAGKVHGAQRDVLFINECNHIDFETFRQLSIRTAKTIFLDWNPTHRFWFEESVEGRDGVALVHSTYKDNPYLSAEQVAEIESNRGDANWWRVYGLGETGSVEGLIYRDWRIVDEMPADVDARRDYIGIDFGFTNDPTAIVRVARMGDALYIDELCYRRGMDNAAIAQLLKSEGCTRHTQIVCDSAEPKSIAEVNAYGFVAVGVRKTPDSVLGGIQILQRYTLNVTRRSVGVIDELRNYSWRQDTDGKWLNKPVGYYDHAMDALRYVALTWLMARHTPTRRATAHVVTGNAW